MRQKRYVVVAVMLFFCHLFAVGQVPIGQWRDCFDYSSVHSVATSKERVYAAVKGGVFAVDVSSRAIERLNKTTSLNDVGVGSIAYDTTTSSLVVVYTNSNIDIIKQGITYNINDIKRSDISGNKDIYSIRFYNRRAYLCCGFGIVVINLDREEIEETFYIGKDGGYCSVFDMAFTKDSMFAATSEGLKRISKHDSYPSVSLRWQQDGRFDSLNISRIATVGDSLLVGIKGDNNGLKCVYLVYGEQIKRWREGKINSLRADNNTIVITANESVIRYDSHLNIIDSVRNTEWGTLKSNDAVQDWQGRLWVGHEWAGLVCIDNGIVGTFMPEGPYCADNIFRITPFNYRMLLCPGGHSQTYENSFLEPNMITTKGTSFINVDKGDGWLDGTFDLMDAAVNPKDTHEIVAAIYGAGIASIRDNKVIMLYDETNTDGALQPYVVGSYRSLRTSAMAFDNEGNLWTTVSHSPYSLAVRTSGGQWRSFNTSNMTSSMPRLDKIIWDSIRGYKWYAGSSNEIYVHDGENRMAKIDPNNGSKLTTETVTALVQDQEGNIWIGTNKGIKVIYDGYKAFDGGGNGEVSPVTCSNITITNGSFYEYLMAYESITAIAVDGANRKWVGTSAGGLYLLSANGSEQLLHFTASNSSLISDKIVCLAVQPRTGEVFIGTDKGLQVYRSTAAYAESFALEHIYAFPNPVKPDYEGPIAIKGFTRNGRIHITDAAGHVVFITRAEGGQAIWYGRTNSGEKVASGVYYVFASDDNGDNRSVAKVLIVR